MEIVTSRGFVSKHTVGLQRNVSAAADLLQHLYSGLRSWIARKGSGSENRE